MPLITRISPTSSQLSPLCISISRIGTNLVGVCTIPEPPSFEPLTLYTDSDY